MTDKDYRNKCKSYKRERSKFPVILARPSAKDRT